MRFMNLKELLPGTSGEMTVLVRSMSRMAARNNSAYQKIVMRDTAGNEASALCFDNLLPADQSPLIIHCMIENQEGIGGIKIKKWDLVETPIQNLIHFLPKNHVTPKACWSRYLDKLKELRPGMQKVVSTIYLKNKAKLMQYPLNESGAFSRRCGAAEATVKLVAMAEKAADVQGLDKPLMVAGALLYHIECLDLLTPSFGTAGKAALISPGISAYHQLLNAVEEVRLFEEKEEKESSIEAQDIELLGHILLSRQGGIYPAIPEAACLRLLDSMLIQSDEMMTALTNTEPGTMVLTPANVNKRVYQRFPMPDTSNQENTAKKNQIV